MFSVLLYSLWVVLPALQGCRSTLMTNRSQQVLIPETEEIQLGKQAFEEALSSEPASQQAELVDMVERVGQRLAAVAGKPEYDWEFRVIAQLDQRAFALPGGKVAISEGMLPICESEAGLAVVLSHEIAHAIARHGSERMTQQASLEEAAGMLEALTQENAYTHTTGMIRQAYGVDAAVGARDPFSQQHEAEADAIGLILMARAGYDPSVAPEFWERFAATPNAQTLGWLSAHFSDVGRSADLRALLPEAMKYYEAAEVQLGMGEPLPLPYAGDVQPGNNGQLAKVLQPAHASVVIGEGTVKRNPAGQIVHTPIADQPASAPVPFPATRPVDNAQISDANSSEFKLPIKLGAEHDPTIAAPEVEAIDPLGWESSGQ